MRCFQLRAYKSVDAESVEMISIPDFLAKALLKHVCREDTRKIMTDFYLLGKDGSGLLWYLVYLPLLPENAGFTEPVKKTTTSD